MQGREIKIIAQRIARRMLSQNMGDAITDMITEAIKPITSSIVKSSVAEAEAEALPKLRKEALMYGLIGAGLLLFVGTALIVEAKRIPKKK